MVKSRKEVLGVANWEDGKNVFVGYVLFEELERHGRTEAWLNGFLYGIQTVYDSWGWVLLKLSDGYYVVWNATNSDTRYALMEVFQELEA